LSGREYDSLDQDLEEVRLYHLKVEPWQKSPNAYADHNELRELLNWPHEARSIEDAYIGLMRLRGLFEDRMDPASPSEKFTTLFFNSDEWARLDRAVRGQSTSIAAKSRELLWDWLIKQETLEEGSVVSAMPTEEPSKSVWEHLLEDG
jgi:hypothetical protein